MATKKERRQNRKKNASFSSFYSVISFLCSFVYLIIDVISENNLFSAIFAFSLLILSMFLCKITIPKLRVGIEQKDKRIMQWNDRLIESAQTVGYLSYFLLAVTLFIAIVRFALAK